MVMGLVGKYYRHVVKPVTLAVNVGKDFNLLVKGR